MCFVLGSNVGDLVNMARKLIGNINDGGMMKSLMGNPDAENSGIQNGKEFSVPLLVFLFIRKDFFQPFSIDRTRKLW